MLLDIIFGYKKTEFWKVGRCAKYFFYIVILCFLLNSVFYWQFKYDKLNFISTINKLFYKMLWHQILQYCINKRVVFFKFLQKVGRKRNFGEQTVLLIFKMFASKIFTLFHLFKPIFKTVLSLWSWYFRNIVLEDIDSFLRWWK